MKRNNEKTSTALYMLNITLRLVVICAVIALLVATVNFFAAPVIESNAKLATEQAIGRLFDGAEISISEMQTVIPDDAMSVVDTIYMVTAGGDSAEILGYCAQLSPTGFKGEVDLIAAFDTDAFIKGIEITSTNDETSGIGTKVTDASFTDKFVEISGGEPISTDAKDYIISGATKTSKPVTESVFTAKRIVASLVQQTENSNDTEDGQELSDTASDAAAQNNAASSDEPAVSEEQAKEDAE